MSPYGVTGPQWVKWQKHTNFRLFLIFPSTISAGLGEELEKYVAETWPDGVVRIVRLKQRAGLIRARMAGAEAATGEVIVFLDSHCEANVGW